MAKGKVNVKLLKKNLTLPMHDLILKAIGIPIFSKSAEQWILWTGEKNKNPFDGSPKLYFYVSSHIFVSYTSACSMDIIGLVQRRLKVLGQPCDFMSAINLILSVTGLDTDAVQRINTNPNIYDWESSLGKYIRVRRGESSLPEYNPIILDQLSTKLPEEWLDEGISADTMEKYQIRYYDHDCSTVIPAFDKDGKLVGARVREWNPDRIEGWGKYHPLQLQNGSIYKFSSNALWFGLNFNWAEIERSGVVMIGESEKFVMKLDSIYGEKNKAVGMFGSVMSTQKRNELIKLGASKVIYVPDCDYIGKDEKARKEWEQKIFTFGKQWKGYASVEVVYDADMGLLGAKDNATDKDEETWYKLYENRQSLT